MRAHKVGARGLDARGALLVLRTSPACALRKSYLHAAQSCVRTTGLRFSLVPALAAGWLCAMRWLPWIVCILGFRVACERRARAVGRMYINRENRRFPTAARAARLAGGALELMLPPRLYLVALASSYER